MLLLSPVRHHYLMQKGGGTEEEKETGDNLLWQTCATCSSEEKLWFQLSSPAKGPGCLLDRCPPAVGARDKHVWASGGTARPSWQQREINATYLGDFEELRYPSHSGEEFLINVQTLFTLRLLHVKVFLFLGHKATISIIKCAGEKLKIKRGVQSSYQAGWWCLRYKQQRAWWSL